MEVKQRIYGYAVTHSDPIMPSQIKPRSNKFYWSQLQSDSGSQCLVPLAVVELSRTCHQIYDEVVTSHIFYKSNVFSFRYPEHVITYLVAITPSRLSAIRSIQCVLPFGTTRFHDGGPDVVRAFTLLNACKGLQDLQLDIFPETISNKPSDFQKMAGYKELLEAARGLRSISLTLPPNLVDQKPWKDAILPVLQEESRLERNLPSVKSLRDAQRTAKLDIIGEGRLGEDRQPGIVATRTRQQKRNFEMVDPDGILPPRVVPKYSLSGDLAWHIFQISSSRQSEESIYGVQFLVKSAPTYNDPGQECWEDVSALDTCVARGLVLEFYRKNPEADGARHVLHIWKLDVHNEDDKDRRKLNSFTKALETRIKRQDEIKQRIADAMAREKTKAKGKKAKRGSASNH